MSTADHDDPAVTIALRTTGLARRFGQRWVLRGVDLDVAAGEVLALTGRNGSGKTTLLRICTTALRPTRGSVHVFGEDVVANADAVRTKIGYLGHSAGLYDDLTAGENLGFSQRMAGAPAGPDAISRALESVGLADAGGERVRGFSAGMRRRLALARLLLRPPRLLLLDEPYASFDIDGIQRVNDFAREVAAGGGAVVVATHDIARGRSIFSRRLHIVDGRTVPETLATDAASALAAGPR